MKELAGAFLMLGAFYLLLFGSVKWILKSERKLEDDE